ncbi:unnamed protein product [Adineta steineri]|uniref:NAD(P)(+)--arginine ADP-ribosyltransferase n=1 Tax=Adineta steineri TaxID=433720 RepID=A0A819L196_9BILA|nr:unnamed protein product [Adineta steineri]CAF1396342.1 unnamed protein product [Adineta steineri]CAF3580680.1 unnamed protein product [Adineta steineri]CAF3957578.1 unnamed protein product [Adineta steineri]
MSMLPSKMYVNIEEYFLLWVNISLQEFHTVQSRLRSSISHQKLFNDVYECEEYIFHKTSKDDRIVLIINNTNICQDFLSRIYHLRQISSIYILCVIENNNELFKQWTKMKNIFREIDKLIIKVEFDHNQRRDRNMDTALAFNVFNINNCDRSSLDINAEFLHSLLIIDVILRMNKIPLNQNKELIDLCQNAYSDNPIELENIEQFVLTYTPNQALWWYTSNTFLFRILNKAFRVDNTNLLYLLRSYIYDLHVQLQQCQSHSCLRVYRGQLITLEELNHLNDSIGHYISIKSFFSTSLNRDLAIFYLGLSQDCTTNFRRILFEINADPNIDSIKPFANISSFSAFPNEEEVLFAPRTIFQIENIIFDRQDEIYCIQMTLCGEKQNHLNDIYEQNRKHYGGGEQKVTNLLTLGIVFQRMGKLDDAEILYRRQLEEFSSKNILENPLISTCYFSIGEILREKGEYDASMIWYQKSLDKDRKTFQDDHPNIGNTYNSIGIVQEKKGDYENALDSYNIALKIALKTFGWNNTYVALCLNNIGNTYQALDNYLKALDCHRIALMIRQNNLPSNHHRLAASHNNIAVVYHRLSYFDLAYEHYKIALQIVNKSLPPYHSDIRLIARNIALLYENQDYLHEAPNNYEQEANRLNQFLTYDHVDIIQIKQDIERIKNLLF